jgi:hypothetical protein
MSKKTTKSKPAPAKETSANDKARADALAKLNAKARPRTPQRDEARTRVQARGVGERPA